jgi:hypothetical protein
MSAWIEMAEPGSDEYKKLEPSRPREECEQFIRFVAAPAVLAGCKFRIVNEPIKPKGEVKCQR